MKLNEDEFLSRLRKIDFELGVLLVPAPSSEEDKEKVKRERLQGIYDELHSLLGLVQPEIRWDEILSEFFKLYKRGPLLPLAPPMEIVGVSPLEKAKNESTNTVNDTEQIDLRAE